MVGARKMYNNMFEYHSDYTSSFAVNGACKMKTLPHALFRCFQAIVALDAAAHFDSKGLQVLIVGNIGVDTLSDSLCSFLAIFLIPFSVFNFYSFGFLLGRAWVSKKFL